MASALAAGCASGDGHPDQGTSDDLGVITTCAENPCGSNGECTDTPTGATCNCILWWTGERCDVFDHCFGRDCGEGTCVNGSSGATCTCPSGRTGESCEEDVDECAGNPCANGRCENTDGGFTCVCDAGFEGDRCDVNTDDCGLVNCGVGTCVDQVNRVYCACPSGVGGIGCTVTINGCMQNPCAHGTCLDSGGVFQGCACEPGWEGPLCERSVDDCPTANCQNGSRCQDANQGYVCGGCYGYTGTDCDTPVTCSGSPPPAPANGSAGAPTGSSFGDTVTYTCDGNYRVTGDAQSHCGADGNWTPAPTCECEAHELEYEVTGDYYIFAPIIDAFRAEAGVNIDSLNTIPMGPGRVTLRVPAAGDVAGDGEVRILEFFLPLEFEQFSSLNETTFVRIVTDIDAWMPYAECGHAIGTKSGDTVTWGTCEVEPDEAITTFTPEQSLDPDGEGCLHDYNTGGVITCESGTSRVIQCMTSANLLPLPDINIANGVWDQKLPPITFGGADLFSDGFTLGSPGQDISTLTAPELVDTHILIPNDNTGTATFIALRGTLREARRCVPSPSCD